MSGSFATLSIRLTFFKFPEAVSQPISRSQGQRSKGQKHMKHKLILPLMMVLALTFSCDDEGIDPTENCIEVTLVAELCGQAVLQVVSDAHFNLGENGWEWNDTVYNNVFSTDLSCDAMQNMPRDGSSFTIRLVEDQDPGNCAVCLALFSGRPDTFHYVEMVDNCNQPLGSL